MSTNYPGALDSYSTFAAGEALASKHRPRHIDVQDAVVAIETELGIDPAGAAATVAARLTALEGAGGAVASLVGANNSNLTWLGSLSNVDFYCRQFTTSGEGILHSVGLFLRMTDPPNVFGSFSVAVFTDDGGEPGLMLGTNTSDAQTQAGDSMHWSPLTARWFHQPIGVPLETADDYWLVARFSDVSTLELGQDAGSGTGVSGRLTSGGAGWWVENGSPGAGGSGTPGFTADTDEYMIRGLFQLATIT